MGKSTKFICYLILFSLFIHSCSDNTNKEIHSNQVIIGNELVKNTYRDNNGWIDTLIYVKKKLHHNLSQWQIENIELSNYYVIDTINLPSDSFKSINSNKNRFLYPIAFKDITIENTQYRIIKYLYDEKNSVDEEATMFLVEDFGLIFIRSLAWSGYFKFLYNEKEEKNNIIRALIDSILNDEEFLLKLPDREKIKLTPPIIK